jgi:endonuclease YncB( thermonuclease family)
MQGLEKLIGAVLVAIAMGVASPAASDVGSRAIVQDDGTLRINGKTVHLYGIYIPTLDYTCRTILRPAQCAPRAVLQLDFKVHGFVYCKRVHRNADGSETAICRTGRDREDLAAWLLYQGWAVARPGAPIEYVTLERFAKANHRGFWGFQADSITFRRPQPR